MMNQTDGEVKREGSRWSEVETDNRREREVGGDVLTSVYFFEQGDINISQVFLKVINPLHLKV